MKTPSLPNEDRKKAGFSLLELMMVVAVIGVTAGIATMEILANRPTHDLNHACWQIKTQLRNARTMAVSENKDVSYTIDPSAKTLTLSIDRNNDGSFSSSEETVTDMSTIQGLRIENLLGSQTGTFDGRGNFTGKAQTTEILRVGMPKIGIYKWITIFPTGQIQMADL